MKRPIAYITAPWGENEFENTENAAKYCRAVYDAGFSPICPMLFLPLFLSDEIPQEHKDGIDMAREYLRRSHGRLFVVLMKQSLAGNSLTQYRKSSTKPHSAPRHEKSNPIPRTF